MDRIALRLACLALITTLGACSNQHTSAPLLYNSIEYHRVNWASSTDAIVTHCKTNDVTQFDFSLDNQGHWQSSITLRNIDTQFYRPQWNNHIRVVLSDQNQSIFSLDLIDEAIPSKSKHTYQRSGKLEDQQLLDQLKPATVNIEHHCHGILRRDTDNANLNAQNRREIFHRG